MISFRAVPTAVANAAKNDFAREEFLSRFAANLPAFASELGLAERELASLRNDALVFRWVVDSHAHNRATAWDWMAYMKRLRDGAPDDERAPEDLPASALSSLPPGNPVPGIFRRVGGLVERIKCLPGYTAAMGARLGFGECEWMIDAAWARPFIRVSRVGRNHPEVVWQKFQYDGLVLEVDRDGNGFTFLGIDTVPNFIDTHPLPPFGSDAVWRYRAIYQVGDEPAGQWSEVAELHFLSSR